MATIEQQSSALYAKHGQERAWRKELLLALTHGKPLDENARRVFEWILELEPDNPAALNGLGRVALKAKDYARAREYFIDACLSDPVNPRPRLNAAVASDYLRDFKKAAFWARRALQCDPGCIDAYIEMVSITDQLCDDEAQLKAIEDGLAVDPGNDALLFARSCLELKNGQWLQGWADYEHRPSRLELVEKLDELPEWTGEYLGGKTLLVFGDQGFGDHLMFARYLNVLPKDIGRLIVYTRPELARLFGAFEVVTSDRELLGVDIDFWTTTASLPHVLKIGPPVSTPFQPSVNRHDYLRFQALIPMRGRLRVGFAWRGNPDHVRDSYRSLPWETLEPLTKVEGCDFYSLQMNDGESPLPKLRDECRDWADMAAAIKNLDLVISVDTGVAHLAATLGVDTWILLSKMSDWRWGKPSASGWSRTPWYRDVDLYQQHATDNWESLVERVRYDIEHRFQSWVLVVRPKDLEPPEPEQIISKPCRYGEMSFFRDDIWLGRSLDLYGEWSESEVALFRDLLKPGDTVVEAGANIGAHTIALASIVGSNGQVLAYEPDERNCKLLRDNVAPHAYVCQFALGKDHGLAVLNWQRGNPGGTSVAVPDLLSHSDCRVIPLDMQTAGNVETNLCNHVDFLKIDVEGMELDVLQGAEQTIQRDRPLIYAENDRPGATEKLLAWFTEHGYKVYQHIAPLYNPNNFQGYKVNVFGNISSLMLLAVPKERYLDQKIIDRHELSRVRLSKKRT